MSQKMRAALLVCAGSVWAAAQGPAAAARQEAQAQSSAPVRQGARSEARRRLDGAAQRNENVPLYRIDNEAIKEANVRLGGTVVLVSDPPAERGTYASEYGQPVGAPVVLPAAAPAAAWRAEAYWWHQNSVFNARTFFQVGDVLPSRRNAYGARAAGSLGRPGNLTLLASQNKIRGMVNGNVLVPLAGERTPRASDPQVRAVVARFLAAYPAALPNRPDFDPRALNTNAPQRVDETQAEARWDLPEFRRGRLSASHLMGRQRVRAFQLVAGQNPDTDIHSHRSQLTWRLSAGPRTEAATGLTFQRVRSALLPEPNAVGPKVRIGFQIEELGPDNHFPIDRAENSFRWGVIATRRSAAGAHAVTLGGEVTRYQLNGIESNNQRGYFQFSNNFGRTAIENLLYGTPTTYEVTVGELARGFRNWAASLYAADRWRVRPGLQLYYGLRYELETAPVEVNRMDRIPYGCDCNNVSPRLALAFNAGAGWTARASYTISFGRIPAVTYQQIRNNPPHVRYVQVQNPDLVNPLHGVNLDDPRARYSPTFLSPDLVSPYSHQYNLSLERELARGSRLRLGYVGSRTFKLMNVFIQNRAEPVPGIPLTTATVDLRRPDPRYYEVKHIVNGGMAWLDAAQATLEIPSWRGSTWGFTYTFGKSLDQGVDYSSTAANRDLTRGRSQWQYDNFRDRKGLSEFDATHSLFVYWTYDLPRASGLPRLAAWWLDGWQLSGAALLKTGTPFTLYIGSDAPGFGNVDGGPGDRPHILEPSILGRSVAHPDTATRILRRERFDFIRPGEFRGNLGRNTFRKDGIANLNAALSKQWRWSGLREWTFQLRAEAYNLANHPQFDQPQRNLSAPSFGQITNTLNDGRVLQIGLRVSL
ncbi:MAG TPA: TonB-dependent receptor [Bryobacteraceae bacterium]|nr:TonB-dependent receptor [Bryobacteraceae bacterium]